MPIIVPCRHLIRTSFIGLMVTLLLAVDLPGARDDEIVLPDIVRRSDSATIPISVNSSDNKIQNLLTRAFSTHGAFTLKKREDSMLRLSIEPASANSVQLSVDTGKVGQAPINRVVAGSDGRSAALRAADMVVTMLLQQPGYFAGKIAFVSNRNGVSEVYVSDPFFERVKQLTHDRSQLITPRWSPDGRTILYTSYHRNGFPDIYRIDVNSGQRKVFASFEGANTGATYSPGGNRVAMILSAVGNAELYWCDTTGKHIHRLTDSNGLESHPSWSPDGNRLVISSDEIGGPQLYTIAASGGPMRRIRTDISGYCAEPVWNPVNSSLIAFTIAQGKEFEIALFDFSTGKSRVITQGEGDAIEPAWTNDGRHLIYTSRTDIYRHLVLLDTITGKATALHDNHFGSAWQGNFVY